MNRRTSLLAVLPLVALVLFLLARRDPPAQPEHVAPPSAGAPVAPKESAVTETSTDPAPRASIAEPARGLTVSGTVRDAKSTLAGAKVSLWFDEHSPATALGQAVTGADGGFSFPVETDRSYLLACTAPGHGEGQAEARPGTPAEIYLASREATTELYGRVQAPDDKPVTDFTIEVMSIRGSQFDSILSSKPIHSPTGEYRVQFRMHTKSSKLMVGAYASGFDPGSKRLEDVREGTSTDVGALELKPLLPALEGIVEDALTKKPVASAFLEALCEPPGQQRGTETGPDGTFQFSVPPDQRLAALSVRAEGYAPRVIELGVVDGLLHVELGAGATIHGHVSLAGDAKPGDFQVECWEQQGRNVGPWEPGYLRGIATISAEGEFELTHIAPVPLYVALYREVRADGRRELYRSQIQIVLPREGQRSEVDFRTSGQRAIRAHLLPKSGGIVVGRLFDASGTLVSTTETVGGGDLIFPGLPTGRYEIRVCMVDPEHHLARSVEVANEDLVLGDWDLTDLRGKR